MIGPLHGATHAEAKMYSSRTDAIGAAPIPYLGNIVPGVTLSGFSLGESSLKLGSSAGYEVFTETAAVWL